jgi:cell division protein FtsW
MLLAWHCARRIGQMHKVSTGLLPGLLIVGLVAGLIATEDLGTAVLVAGAGSLMLIAAGARLWHFALAIPVGIAGAVVAVVTSPYRVQRLVSFIDPYADPQGSGYHMIQSLVAVANGEVWGRGLGFGLQKFGYLPEDETDFLFAIICEELGIAGAAAVIALYAGLLWTGLGIVRKQHNPLLKLLGMGIVCTVALQTLINLMVVTGLAPTKGIALPLLSSGGTGWILTAGSLGLLVSMDRIADRAAERANLLIEPRDAGVIREPEPIEPLPAERDAAAA